MQEFSRLSEKCGGGERELGEWEQPNPASVVNVE